MEVSKILKKSLNRLLECCKHYSAARFVQDALSPSVSFWKVTKLFNISVSTCDCNKNPHVGGMENLLISSSAKKGRSLVLTEDANGAVDWIDAAELAESVGITFEQYPEWINSMHEIGAVAVSDRIAH